MSIKRVSRCLAALTILLFCGLSLAQECSVLLKQSKQDSMAGDNGKLQTTYSVSIINNCPNAVSSLYLNAPGISKVWQMELLEDGSLGFPAFMLEAGGLVSGQTFTFGYMVEGDAASELSVDEIHCGDEEEEKEKEEEGKHARSEEAAEESGEAKTEVRGKKPCRRPTKRPTQRPTNPPTQRPTSRPTNAPTSKPTNAPTSKPTNSPTSKPTNAPTSKPTSAPTSKPTSAPTSKPTSSPTTAPSGGNGGRICPAGQIWRPAPGTTWQWQLTGTVDQSVNVQMYDIDLFDASQSLIDSLHSKGRAVICYFSTQYEDWRPDASQFPANTLGNNLDDWPGEKYVDIRAAAVRNVIKSRLDIAASKKCDGVEPDNVDSYENNPGFPLTKNDQIDFNNFIASEAHKRGLSVGLKNVLDLVSVLQPNFDWALNEQCYQYGECSMLDPFIKAGKAAFGVEYQGSASSFCPAQNAKKYSWLLKDLSLNAKLTQCCASAAGGCVSAPYTCVTVASAREERDTIPSLDEVAALSAVSDSESEMFIGSASALSFSVVAFVALAAVRLAF